MKKTKSTAAAATKKVCLSSSGNHIIQPLQMAVYKGEFEKFRELLDKNRNDINLVDDKGRSLFHYLALGSANQSGDMSNNLKLAELIYQLGLDINGVDYEGNTPLHLSCGSGRPDIVHWLIGKKALNIVNIDKKTPLELAKISYEAAKSKFEAAKSKFSESTEDKKILEKALLERSDYALFRAGRHGLLNYLPPLHFHNPVRFSLRTAYMMALLSKLIYEGSGSDFGSDVPSTGALSNGIIRAFIERWNLDFVKVAEEDSARGMIIRKEIDKQMHYLIAFKGTNTSSLEDIKADLNASKNKSKLKHSGFHQHLKKIIQPLLSFLCSSNTKCSIYITGHSLGGAMATLMMDKLYELGYPADQLHLYTFGQPRVGTEEFQKKFDSVFSNAYLVQRHGDLVPMLPRRSGSLMGGYLHSGSLRFLDDGGQLYNDLHYRYEDIRRCVSSSDVGSMTLNQLRHSWTDGLQQFFRVEEECVKAVEEDKIKIEDSKIDPLSQQDDVLIKDVNAISSFLTNKIESISSHKMENYLKDIARLSQRVNQPFSWDEPHEAITSQKLTFTLTRDTYDSESKKNRYKREREQAYLHWVDYYTQLPKMSYKIQTESQTISRWLENEGAALNHIKQVEKALFNQFPDLLNYNEKCFSSTSGNSLHLSPLVELAMHSSIYLLSQVLEKNKDIAVRCYQWLYWGLPEAGYFLKLRNTVKGKNNYELVELKDVSPYRDGLVKFVLLLGKSDKVISAHFSSSKLRQLIKSDSGKKIEKLSISINRMQLSKVKKVRLAKVTLVRLNQSIVAEIVKSLKKTGLNLTLNVAAVAALGVVSGTVAGVATGLVVAGATGGTATPAAIAAGVAVGSTVCLGTSAIAATGLALKKLPELVNYFDSLENVLEAFKEDVLNLSVDLEENERKKIIKNFVKKYPTQSHFLLLWINVLCLVTISNSKLLHENGSIDIRKLNSSAVVTNSRRWEGNKRKLISNELKIFFEKFISLINIYIASLSINDGKIKNYLSKLDDMLLDFNDKFSTYRQNVSIMAEVLSIREATVGFDFYEESLYLDKVLYTLNQVLADELELSAKIKIDESAHQALRAASSTSLTSYNQTNQASEAINKKSLVSSNDGFSLKKNLKPVPMVLLNSESLNTREPEQEPNKKFAPSSDPIRKRQIAKSSIKNNSNLIVTEKPQRKIIEKPAFCKDNSILSTMNQDNSSLPKKRPNSTNIFKQEAGASQCGTSYNQLLSSLNKEIITNKSVSRANQRGSSHATTQRNISSVQRGSSTIQRGASTLKRSISPIQKRDNSSIQRGSSPAQKDSNPAQRYGSSIQRGVSPVQRGSSPIQRGSSPIQRGGSPVQRSVSPVQRGGSPVIQRGGSPVQRGGSPVVRRGGSPVKRGGSPVVQRGGSPVQRGGSSVQRGINPNQRGGGNERLRDSNIDERRKKNVSSSNFWKNQGKDGLTAEKITPHQPLKRFSYDSSTKDKRNPFP